MIVFPAIDLLGGRCVRLTEGRFDRETVYADDPVAVARAWAEQGADWLHVVDLDGAKAGRPVHLALVAAIARESGLPVQIGGGIRDLGTVEEVLAAGAARVILGSVAVRNPALVAEACRKFGERIIVGIDARDGKVAVDGWLETSEVAAGELAARMAAAGVARIVYTDIGRDGTLTGVNVAATVELARTSGIAIIASGGVSGVQDILALKAAAEPGIEGVIAGKALYSGAMTLADALRAAKEGR